MNPGVEVKIFGVGFVANLSNFVGLELSFFLNFLIVEHLETLIGPLHIIHHYFLFSGDDVD